MALRVGTKLCCVLALGSTAACTEPMYGSVDAGAADDECNDCKRVDASPHHGDAGPADKPQGRTDGAIGITVPDGSASTDPGADDAGSTTGPAVPTGQTRWPDSILGTFAIRMRFFGNDATLSALALILHEKVALAVVTREDPAGPVSMKFTICRDFGKLQSPLSAGVIGTTVYPERLEPVLFTLVESQGVFHTEAAPRLIGYDDKVPASCASASTAPKRAEQVWLTSALCECGMPSSPPTKLNDCRVTDPDRDGHPGVTIELSGSSTGKDYVRFRDQSQLSAGKLSGDGRHTGLWLENNDYYQLQCATGICARTAYRACKPEVNPVLFAPLLAKPGGGEWTCEDMLKRADTGDLFPNDMLAYPNEC